MNMRDFLLMLLVLILLGFIGFFLTKQALAPSAPAAATPQSVIGTSHEERPIEVFTFGTGESHLLFVGGIHGGYEWNTIVLAEEMVAAFTRGELRAPETVTVHIIPNLNPDGTHRLFAATKNLATTEAQAADPDLLQAGRYNAAGVDLNRNFDCNWQPESEWRGQTVNAGQAPFSEPEAVALRDYVLKIRPSAAVFWHSKADAVYASACNGERVGTTKTLMQQYARAAGYTEVLDFDAYEITGDAESWLASIGIPAITVELETRTDSELERNKAGVMAILALYGEIPRE